MIGIYNKGSKRTNGTFIQNIMPCAEPQSKVCGDISELAECNIAIAHASEKDWDQLITKYSSNGDVRVRVTVGGGFSDKAPRIDENGVYIFHLVSRAGELEAKDWKEILSELSKPEAVKALVNNKNHRLRHFFEHEVQEHLSALTILCEGYLAVHAEAKDKGINSALKLMKWTEFRESERGQKLIRSDLDKKMDAVQQSEWWLNVFEKESFCEDVKKEWRDTTGEEKIPRALNNLLEAIRSGKSVVPPKIVADVYCVIQKKKMITAPSEWQIRRNKFNHDWLKNKFLNSFNEFIDQLQRSHPDTERVSEFLLEDFPAWESRREDARWIVQSFENGMSPRKLLSYSPLNRCANETREWLGHLVHELWLFRYSVKEKAKESQDALVEVNKLYEKMAHELEKSMPIKLTQLISLHPQFCELKKTYETLSKTLSNLPRYELYGG